MTFIVIFCLKPERSYKKSKKHKKKGKKRRHKSVSIQEGHKIHLSCLRNVNVHVAFVHTLIAILTNRHHRILTMRRKEETVMESVIKTSRKIKRMTSLGGNLAPTLNRSLRKGKQPKKK